MVFHAVSSCDQERLLRSPPIPGTCTGAAPRLKVSPLILVSRRPGPATHGRRGQVGFTETAACALLTCPSRSAPTNGSVRGSRAWPAPQLSAADCPCCRGGYSR